MALLKHAGSTDILFPENVEPPPPYGNESCYSSRSRYTDGSPDTRPVENHNSGYMQRHKADNCPRESYLSKSFDEDFTQRIDGSFEDEANGNDNAFGKREGSSRSYIAQIKDNITKYVKPSSESIKKFTVLKDRNANVRPKSTPKARERNSNQWNCQSLIPPPQSARSENQRNSYGGQPNLSPFSVRGDINIGRHRNSIDSGFAFTRQDSFANSQDSKNNEGNLKRQLPLPPGKANVQPQNSFSSLSSYSVNSQGQGETYTVEELYTIPHTFAHQVVIRQKQAPPPPPPPKPRVNANITKLPSKEGQTRNASFQLQLPASTPRRPHSDAGIIEDTRRRTWSPNTFSKAMGNGSSFDTPMRSYHSNDALDDVTGSGNDMGGENVYEDLDKCQSGDAKAPPKLAPISGKLQQNAHKTLIKPIAFKPIPAPQSRYALPPQPAQFSPHPHQQGTSPHPHPHPQPHVYGSNMRTNAPAHFKQDSPPDISPIARSYRTDGKSVMISPRIGGVVNFDAMKDGSVNNNLSQDDGYVSQDFTLGLHSHSNSNTSHNGSMHSAGSHNGSMHSGGGGSHNGSMHNDSDRSMDRSLEHSNTGSAPFVNNSLPRPTGDRPECYHPQPANRLAGRGDSFVLTPSPSDSGVGELEAMLRDKDNIIQHLRETMERNESAILQVCLEKEQNWEMELREIHGEWQRRWRHHTERAKNMEQALLQQLFKLQQERKTLKLDLENLRTDMDKSERKCTDCETDLKQTRSKLDEVNWELAQKNGEIALLKTQLKDANNEAANKGNDVVSIKTALKHQQHSSDEKDHEILTLEAQLKTLKDELAHKASELVTLSRDSDVTAKELGVVKKNLHVAQQQVDLKELQMEMKSKELERLETEHKKCTSSSPKFSQVGAILNGMPALPGGEDSELEPPILSNSMPPQVLLANNNSKSNTASSSLAQPKGSATVASLSAELASLRADFTHEREQWLDEKNKVIRYQKHLQLNYVQMYRKNKVLEAEVEQLTLELEKRDVCMMEPVKEAEESVC